MTLAAMTPGAAAALVAGAFALAVGAWVLTWYLARKRREAWQAVAGALGLTYEGADIAFADSLERFRLFSTGRGRRADNVLRGHNGEVAVCVADYRYTTGSGKNSTVHRQTVCILEHPSLRLPRCYARPQRSVLDAIGKVFGGQDIDFPEDPAFSAAYVLQGDEPESVQRTFAAPIRRFLTERRELGLRVEAEGQTIVFHRGRQVAPAEAQGLIDGALELLLHWL